MHVVARCTENDFSFYLSNGRALIICSCLEKIIVQGYKALGLEYFFTAGPDEVKAWTIQKHTKAPQAAGRIHTDFEKGFIMAEVMKFNDFKEEGSEAAAKVSAYSSYSMNSYSVVKFTYVCTEIFKKLRSRLCELAHAACGPVRTGITQPTACLFY